MAELGAARGADAEADGEDGGEGVVFDVAGDLAGAFGLNYSILSNSCRGIEFAFSVKLCQVVVYSVNPNLESSAMSF